MGNSSAAARRLRAVCALVLAFAAAPAAAFELPELMTLLGKTRASEARFVERRFVQGFDVPLESSGTLSFTAPDRLTRRTTKPREEAMEVAGNSATLTRNGRSRNVALDSVPEMAAVVEAMRGTLGGHLPSLQRHFGTALTGSAEQWTLELLPLEATLAQQVQRVRIGGRHGEVLSIEMELAGGDRSLMLIEPAPPASSPS